MTPKYGGGVNKRWGGVGGAGAGPALTVAGSRCFAHLAEGRKAWSVAGVRWNPGGRLAGPEVSGELRLILPALTSVRRPRSGSESWCLG